MILRLKYGEGNHIDGSPFTGNQLSGKTVTISGDTFKVQHSPGLHNYSQYEVTNIEAVSIAVASKSNPNVPITSLIINASASTTVARGTTRKFEVKVNGGAVADNIKWAVSNTTLAVVNNDGSVTILNKTGTVILTATDTVSGLSNSIVLRIV